ncbi:hypothetical protein HHL28_08465 [Aerophototrophica crusticola]|uniref:Uncharacterized protein n=1 Tax=Aerophototrophica crusticola TaxID=1709002 RepID=A0A858R6D7_9PROT|nr:hypothetical protein HHL28_08465 [Rhodospirillaceae bacterium B3]
MSGDLLYVGVDVSKDRLDARARPTGEALAVARDGALAVRLLALGPALVVLDAIGEFEMVMAAGLAAAGLPLVNPRQVLVAVARKLLLILRDKTSLQTT